MYSRGVAAAALATTLAGVALAPSGAGATPRSPTAITIHAQPNPIAAGDPVVIFGRLFAHRDAGQLVVLYHHLATSGGGFAPVQTTRTDASGAYEFARADGRVDTNRSWYVAAAGATSRVVNERVAGLVTLSATGPNGAPEPDGSVLQTGRAFKYTFSGTDTPAAAGALVALQRQRSDGGPNDWVTIGRGVTDASGAFSIVHSFVIPSSSGGDANVRVLVRPDVANIASPSDSLSYEIEQTQNPNLTITPSAYLIPEGASDTITGTDAAGTGQPITLYAHTAGSAFAPVASTISGLGGGYSFAVSPTQSTYYRVTASSSVTIGATGTTGTSGSTGASGPSRGTGRNATNSAVSFVGVRDVLSVRTTPTTIQQGGSVTFTGTVSPDQTGRTIYLQRENAAGTGWHVIASATVGASSTYSLTEQFYEAGSESVRIAITGSPQNQGAATPPIAITINAVPANQLPAAQH